MKEKASSLIKRALNLADISNTDFLTFEENIEYINDAWKTVYQWLINKGDKQFVKEVSLGGANFGSITEYNLPSDLYQILSLKDGNSGRIIPRHAESESIASNTYEVVNNKLRLYGVTATNLVLTYWTTPTFITFPNKDVITEFVDGKVKAHYGNTILYLTNWDQTSHTASFVVKNVLTNETYGAFDITDENITDPAFMGNLYYIMGPNVIVISYGGSLRKSYYFDFSGNNYYTYTTSYQDVYEKSIKSNVGVYYYISQGKINYIGQIIGKAENGKTSQYIQMKDLNGIDLGNNYTTANFIPTIWESKQTNELYAVYGLINRLVIYRLSDWEKVYDETLDVDFTRSLDNYFYYNGHFEVTDFGVHAFEGNFHLIITIDDSEDDVKVSLYKERSKAFSFIVNYGFGIDGLNQELKSDIIDTEFNFPNELFFSLIACDLAVRYAMKQNANFEGLTQLYQSMQQTFMNTLSQDGGYKRIKNMYRG